MQKYLNICDEELLRMYVDGDSNAFGVIAKRYYVPVRSFVFSIVKNNTIADDLTQDVFEKALRVIKAGNYEHRDYLKSWLMTVAHNYSINYVRHKNNRVLFSPLPSSGEFEVVGEKTLFPVADNSQNPEEMMIRSETDFDIFELVDKLPPEGKEVIILKYYHDLKYWEIAKFLGNPSGTNRTRMRNSLITLRGKISEIKNHGTSVFDNSKDKN